MNLKRGIGIAMLAVGILLLAWGYNISQSVGSQIKEAFTGSPTDKSMYLIVAGAILSILGGIQTWRGGK